MSSTGSPTGLLELNPHVAGLASLGQQKVTHMGPPTPAHIYNTKLGHQAIQATPGMSHLQSLLQPKGCSATPSLPPDCPSLLPGEPGVAWGPRIRAEALDCLAEEGADVLVDRRGAARGTQPVSKLSPAGGVWCYTLCRYA